MLNSTATKLHFNLSGGQKTISAVEFTYKNNPYKVQVRREVVLSAGAVNSPQLLLLSGVGPKQELDRVGIRQVHELPGVGKNLHNHVTFYMTYTLNALKDINDLDWTTALDYLLNRKGPMSSTGMSQVTARINSKYADPTGTHPDLQIFFAGYLAKCATSGEARSPPDPEHPDAPRHLTLSPVVLHPKSRGHVTLKSKDPLEAPLMLANYLTEPEDVATLVEGVRVCQRLGNTTILKGKYGAELDKEEYGDCAEKYTYDSDDFWACAVKHSTGPENHQGGSCKMGPTTDPLAVVDNKLQVYGLVGVRIMDASVMPTLVSGNTHATCVMIAERGVNFIKEKWLGSVLGNRAGYDTSPNYYPNTQKPVYTNSVNHQHGHHSPPKTDWTKDTPYYGNQGSQHNYQFHQNHPHMPNPFDQDTNNRGEYYEHHQQNNDYDPYANYYTQRPARAYVY